MNVGEIKELTIDTLVYGGDGLGRIDGQVVFVPLSAPQDRLQVRISSVNHDYARAELVDIVEPSPSRVQPVCEVFGRCGGCQWQHISYSEQLQAKMRIVQQALVREGKLSEHHLDQILQPIIPSPSEFYYRHRMQFSVNHRDRTPHIGLYRERTHELIEMKTCHLAHPLINVFLGRMRELFSHFDNRFIQGIDLTVDGQGERLLLVFHFKRGDEPDQKRLYEQIKAMMPEEIVGALLRTEEYKKAKTLVLGGQQLLYPTVGYNLFIGPETFIQVNCEGNKVLVQTVLDKIAQATGGKRVNILELHCGAGNFTLPISRVAREVIGIESCPASVDLARKSVWTHGLNNIQLFSKSDLKGIKFLLRASRSFDLILMDPPRCGCQEILEYIPQLGVQHIIYVSCNPSTLARDIGILTTLGYRVEEVQPIDMFPQTHHVESVVRMKRK
ncbi:MAG: 23S rRNA (uracil(1939)-C(5))-methyltransferase RlmD [bacterium]|nr:23S rRNA (uracil(1939)-C(5))-methyltransferase RlmD [bacterium]